MVIVKPLLQLLGCSVLCNLFNYTKVHKYCHITCTRSPWLAIDDLNQQLGSQ